MGTLLALSPLRSEERRGEPMTLHGRTIRPIARGVRLQWPGGAWEWHRPVAVEVREGDELRRVPIRDTSRLAVVAMVAIGCAFAVAASRRSRTLRTNEG
jgi:hypothetical protein